MRFPDRPRTARVGGGIALFERFARREMSVIARSARSRPGAGQRAGEKVA